MNTTIEIRDTTDTGASTGRRGGFGRRFTTALAGVLLATTALTAVAANEASALTSVRTGYNGGFAFQRVGGQYVNFGTTPGLRIAGPYVTRSTASTDTQTVWFQVVIEQRYNDGRWVTVWNSGMRGTYLVPGQARYLPDMYASLGRGNFRVKQFLYWQDSRNRNLGGVAADYNSSADYYCSIASCVVRPGYISL